MVVVNSHAIAASSESQPAYGSHMFPLAALLWLKVANDAMAAANASNTSGQPAPLLTAARGSVDLAKATALASKPCPAGSPVMALLSRA
jgi:hypothetical protein